MNKLRAFISGRYPLAILAGLLLAASFPKLNVAGLAWIAPALLLASAMGLPGKRAFRLGYVGGFIHYLASLYWLLLIPVPLTWKWAPALGWLALAAFLALYPATWVWLCWKIFPGRLNTENPLTPSLSANWGEGECTSTVRQNCAAQYMSVSWPQRIAWAISGAALWVALEMAIARVFGGYPWNLLGDSQFRMLPLIQIASITGVYGVSFLVVWTSLALFGAAMLIIRRPAMRSAWIGEIILPFAVTGAVFVVGYHKLLQPPPRQPELTVALVQPSIPQSTIWDATENDQRFAGLLELSRRALTNKPDLLIWPEAAVPGLIRLEDDYRRPIFEVARSNKVWMIIGADDFEPHAGAKYLRDSDFFNSSFLISPEGVVTSIYRKRKLVMFGEYVPLTRWLPFLKFLTPITGGFTPGTRPVPFVMTNLNVHVGVLICFEDIFPHLARAYVDEDTDFLVNLTNNGWFGEGAAQWQHGAAAAFRAVENGVPLVRCANNGLTCWVDSCGRLHDVLDTGWRGIYGPGFETVRVPVLFPGERRAPTFYRVHGDWFGWGCVALTICKLVGVRFRSLPK